MASRCCVLHGHCNDEETSRDEQNTNRLANPWTRRSLLRSILALTFDLNAQTSHKNADVLWYRSPAPIWDHALPVGNGRLGAMVFGGANAGKNNGDEQFSRQNAVLLDGSQTSGADEHLQLNESSLWQGSRANRLNPGAHDAVPEIRKLLLESHGLDGAKIAAAEALAKSSMIGIPAGMPRYSTLGGSLSTLFISRSGGGLPPRA